MSDRPSSRIPPPSSPTLRSVGSSSTLPSQLPNLHDKNLYDVLGVDRSFTEDTLRKQYKRQALRYHPDKAGGSDEQFQRIRFAYDVLADESKRDIYDKYGQRGLEAFDRMREYAPFLDTRILKMINSFFVIASVILALLIVFTSFISAKIDEPLGWSWHSVFVPLYIIDALLLFGVFGQVVSKSSVDESEDEDVELGWSEMFASKAKGADRQAGRRALKSREQLLGKVILAVYTLCFVLFQILVACRLDKSISASWIAVFVPWFIVEFLNFTTNTLQYAVALSVGKLPENPDTSLDTVATRPFNLLEKLRLAYSAYHLFLLRVIQAVLIALKADGTISASWVTVFIPTFILIAISIVSIVLLYIQQKRNPQSPELKARYIFSVSSFGFLSLFFVTFFGLLLGKLSNGSPTVAVVLIPIFIFLGIMFCCTCCCGPCMYLGLRMGIEAEFMDDGQVVDVEKRIVWKE